MNSLQKMLELSQDVNSRYEERSEARESTREQIEAGKIPDAEKEQVKQRLERLNIDPETHEMIMELPEEGAKGIIETPAHDVNLLERILGVNDLISVHFLEKGWRSARAVGRIHIAGGRGYGTGFMISPRLMLTNNHVLADEDTAARSYVEFDYQLGADGQSMRTVIFDLTPDELFLTDVGFDFTLVAVQPVNDEERNVIEYGWLPLIPAEGKVIVGEKLNIIQHPGGELKQIALRENYLEDILDNFLHYKTDTAPGSSGAPVFNDQWEVVALHHAGVPQKDEEGNYLTLDGSIWNDSMSPSRLAWKANEGIRISRIIKFIDDQELSETGAALWAEAQTGESPSLDSVSPPPVDHAQTVVPQSTKTLTSVKAPEDVPDELAESFAELSQFDTRVYYDQEQDEKDRESYYGSLAPVGDAEPAFDLTTVDGWHIIVARQQAVDGGNGANAPTFDQLHQLLSDTHTGQPKYSPSQHVYPWVDLHADGKLRSIYSGKVYDPADFITGDFAIEQQRAQQLQSFRSRESAALSEAAVAGFEALLEAQLPYNCEHVVPQSWFGRGEPMRGDLHHLFACESGCNSFRSNIPYFDFEDFGEATRSECGKRVGNKFEPDAGKGAISRAMFYFLVRYPGLIEDHDGEFQKERLPFLIAWHNRYPVSEYERHRNMAIFANQHNRNPFIDFPQWVAHIDFTKGLG